MAGTSESTGPAIIEVRVAGRGRVRDGADTVDPATEARCDLCGADAPEVASVAADTFACASCLRRRLEAMTVARYVLREDDGRGSLPWGKISQ